ncbi:4-hydroxyphenylpyruvate dioxygenase [filamentous cyanobacterium CCP5]|nr:4-hydroxyphenylpyruvate dioxygenase [filamentous cyanobacterium CCP5]
MDIDYLHLYVDQVAPWQEWFIHYLGAQLTGESATGQPVPLHIGQVVMLLSDPQQNHQAATYLQHHPPGVGDIAFRVKDLDRVLKRFLREGGRLVLPPQVAQTKAGPVFWAQVQGWGSLCHTLIERRVEPGDLQTSSKDQPRFIPGLQATFQPKGGNILAIDHVVLNVAAGTLTKAVDWYKRTLGFCAQQQFVIKTPDSGLYSQVLKHPDGSAQLPINEPTTANSQIQEFLNWHRGDGVQHAALLTTDIVSIVDSLRRRGLRFLEVPDIYYEQVLARPGYALAADMLKAIRHQQILIDWDVAQPQAQLLQTFTQPVFGIPTLFFELIERQQRYRNGRLIQAKGFGEGNFQALFEAMEREQSQRGSLQMFSEENY